MYERGGPSQGIDLVRKAAEEDKPSQSESKTNKMTRIVTVHTRDLELSLVTPSPSSKRTLPRRFVFINEVGRFFSAPLYAWKVPH